jgi:hypothetical protein
MTCGVHGARWPAPIGPSDVVGRWVLASVQSDSVILILFVRQSPDTERERERERGNRGKGEEQGAAPAAVSPAARGAGSAAVLGAA